MSKAMGKGAMKGPPPKAPPAKGKGLGRIEWRFRWRLELVALQFVEFWGLMCWRVLAFVFFVCWLCGDLQICLEVQLIRSKQCHHQKLGAMTDHQIFLLEMCVFGAGRNQAFIQVSKLLSSFGPHKRLLMQ